MRYLQVKKNHLKIEVLLPTASRAVFTRWNAYRRVLVHRHKMLCQHITSDCSSLWLGLFAVLSAITCQRSTRNVCDNVNSEIHSDWTDDPGTMVLCKLFSATEDSVVRECFQQFFQSLVCGLKSVFKQQFPLWPIILASIPMGCTRLLNIKAQHNNNRLFYVFTVLF